MLKKILPVFVFFAFQAIKGFFYTFKLRKKKKDEDPEPNLFTSEPSFGSTACCNIRGAVLISVTSLWVLVLPQPLTWGVFGRAGREADSSVCSKAVFCWQIKSSWVAQYSWNTIPKLSHRYKYCTHAKYRLVLAWHGQEPSHRESQQWCVRVGSHTPGRCCVWAVPVAACMKTEERSAGVLMKSAIHGQSKNKTLAGDKNGELLLAFHGIQYFVLLPACHVTSDLSNIFLRIWQLAMYFSIPSETEVYAFA